LDNQYLNTLLHVSKLSMKINLKEFLFNLFDMTGSSYF